MMNFNEINMALKSVAEKADLSAIEFSVSTYGRLGIQMKEIHEAIDAISKMSLNDIEDIVFSDYEAEDDQVITPISELYCENDEGENVLDGFSFGILDPTVGWESDDPNHEAAIAEWLKTIGRESL